MDQEINNTPQETVSKKSFPGAWIITLLLFLLGITTALALVYFSPDFFINAGIIKKDVSATEAGNNNDEDTNDGGNQIEQNKIEFVPVAYNQLLITFDMPKDYTWNEDVNGFGVLSNGAGTYVDIKMLAQDQGGKYPATLIRTVRFSEKAQEFPDEVQLTSENEIKSGKIKELTIMGKRYPTKVFQYEHTPEITPMLVDLRSYKITVYLVEIHEYLSAKIYEYSIGDMEKTGDSSDGVYLDQSTFHYTRRYETSSQDLDTAIKIVESLGLED